MKKAYHIHSTHSDGRMNIDEIIKLAVKENVDELAICDHDTLIGCHEAYEKLHVSDIKLIPGIEISAKNRKNDIQILKSQISLHILGYNFDLFDPDFNQMIINIREKNNEMCKVIIDNLQSDDITFKLSDIKLPKTRHHYFKTDIAKHLVEIGVASDINDAFYRFINSDLNKKYHTYSLSVIDSIKQIQNAKGLAIWAHPYELLDGVNKIDISIDEVERILIELIKFGIDGLEVYYEAYNENQIKQLSKLCDKYALKRFGGSDFHGKPNDKFTCSKWELVK